MGSERTENCDHACDGQATCVTGRCDKAAMFGHSPATLAPEPLAHILYDDEDDECPRQICDANGQVALGLCKICGLGEAELDASACIKVAAIWQNPNDAAFKRTTQEVWRGISARTLKQLLIREAAASTQSAAKDGVSKAFSSGAMSRRDERQTPELQRGDLNWEPGRAERARRPEKPGHDAPITFIDGEPDEMPDAPPTRGEEAPPYKSPPGTTISAADILEEAGDTFRTRNAAYGSNYKMVGKIMAILFPDGVPVELLGADQFHLVELIVVKLSRYAISGLTHIDSARDGAVYFAMCEMVNRNKENKQ